MFQTVIEGIDEVCDFLKEDLAREIAEDLTPKKRKRMSREQVTAEYRAKLKRAADHLGRTKVKGGPDA